MKSFDHISKDTGPIGEEVFDTEHKKDIPKGVIHLKPKEPKPAPEEAPQEVPLQENKYTTLDVDAPSSTGGVGKVTGEEKIANVERKLRTRGQ